MGLWEIERIAEALGVSARIIGRWEENYTLHGCVKPLKGRPMLLTRDTINDIQLLLREDPTLLDEIREWPALYHDQPISTRALHMNLQDLALTHKRLKRASSSSSVSSLSLCSLPRGAILIFNLGTSDCFRARGSASTRSILCSASVFSSKPSSSDLRV